MSPILLTIIYVGCLAVWIQKYTSAGKARRYSENREGFEQKRRFEVLSKVMFLGANGMLLYSFWSNSPWLLKGFEGPVLQALGSGLTIGSTILLVSAMKTLGKNYSPYFDSYKPFQIIKEGPYSLIRHPIYTANIAVMLGLALMSGSWVMLALVVVSNFEMIRAMMREEEFLEKSFPEYRSYRTSTKRLVPFLY